MERLTRSSIANIHRYFLEHCDLQGLAKADSAGHEDIKQDSLLPQSSRQAEIMNTQDDDDGFDEDFDAFEEGADGNDDDFGAFDDGDDTVTPAQDTPSAALLSINAPEMSLVSRCHHFSPPTRYLFLCHL